MIIGIIGAMEEEVSVLKEMMTVEEVVDYASMTFCKGVLCGKDVVIVRSGIGKVNAGICAQILVDKFNAEMLINTGIAGSLDAAIDIGDMVISTDSALVEKALEANREANPEIQTFTGRIVSGDEFVASQEVKNKLVTVFQGRCTEMEGAAIAHAAYLNQVPCVIIRAISDKADNSAEMDYPTFEKLAIERSVKLVKNLLPRI